MDGISRSNHSSGYYLRMIDRVNYDNEDENCDDINDFDYNHGLNRILSADELKRLYWLCENGYEKLQVFRLLGVNANSSIVQKYVNETYHVENEYISQLNPLKFDLIPGYITEICDGLVRDL